MRLRAVAAAGAWALRVGLAVFGVVSQAQAGQFGLSPMRLELGPKARTASLSVYNRDRVPLSFQVEALRWRQDESGQAVNEPTTDLVYFPRLLTVAPGQEGVIRVGLRQPLVHTEHTFVLFVQEQATAAGENADGSAVNVLLRTGATVFVRPVREIARLEWLGGEVRGGAVHFGLRNDGTRHQAYGKVSVTGLDAAGGTVFQNELKAGRYLLAGHTRRFSMPLAAADCGRVARLEVSVATEQTQLLQAIEPGSSPCP